MNVPPDFAAVLAPWLRTTASRRQPVLVTGTDTGVGKTVVSALLLQLAADLGLRPGYYKPFETGCLGRVGSLASAELASILTLAGAAVGTRVSSPYRMQLPASPYTAAMKEGIVFDWRRLDDDLQRLQGACDLVVVEGAGGLMVPIERELTYADLLLRWGLNPLLVVGNRLGCINQALLTLAQCKHCGYCAPLVVVNQLHDQPPAPAESTNLWTLAAVLGRPVVPLGFLHAD